MTDEQFSQMMAVEIAKLAMLQGIQRSLQGIALKQGATGMGHNWNDLAKTLQEGLSQADALRRQVNP